MPVSTNDLKAGTEVMLDDGTTAELMDNRKGNIRNMLVKGFFTERGDTYAWKVVAYKDNDGNWQKVVPTVGQLKNKRLVQAMGF